MIHAIRIVLFAGILFAVSPAFAQPCQNLVLVLHSDVSDGGPEEVAWNIYHAEGGQVASGSSGFSVGDPFAEVFNCLEIGCYEVVLDPWVMPAGPDAFSVQLFSGGIPLAYSDYSEADGLITFSFCLETPDCPDVLEYGNPECGLYQIHVAGNWLNEVNTYWYIVGDNTVIHTGASFPFTPEEPGTYVVAAIYTSELCGAVEIMTEIHFEGCTGDCHIEITAEELGDGWWEFTADGNPAVYPMVWTFDGGEPLLATWVVMQQFEPGEHLICGHVESELCPEPVGECITIVEQVNPECTEVGFGLDSYLGEGGASVIEWVLYDSEGEVHDAGNASYTPGDPYADLTMCLADGCYVMMGCGNVPLNETNFNFFLSDEAELIGFDFEEFEGCTGFIAHFSVNADCNEEECFNNEVVISLSANYDSGSLSDMLLLSLLLNELSIQEIPVILSADMQASITLCLPDGCYSLDVETDVPLSALSALVNITVNGQPVSELVMEQGDSQIQVSLPVGADCVVSVQEENAGEFSFYPNPASAELTLVHPGRDAQTAVLSDSSGRIVRSWLMPGGRTSVPVGDLAPGIYFIRNGSGGAARPVMISR
jgi:hypothetical protein